MLVAWQGSERANLAAAFRLHDPRIGAASVEVTAIVRNEPLSVTTFDQMGQLVQ